MSVANNKKDHVNKMPKDKIFNNFEVKNENEKTTVNNKKSDKHSVINATEDIFIKHPIAVTIIGLCAVSAISLVATHYFIRNAVVCGNLKTIERLKL